MFLFFFFWGGGFPNHMSFITCGRGRDSRENVSVNCRYLQNVFHVIDFRFSLFILSCPVASKGGGSFLCLQPSPALCLRESKILFFHRGRLPYFMSSFLTIVPTQKCSTEKKTLRHGVQGLKWNKS